MGQDFLVISQSVASNFLITFSTAILTTNSRHPVSLTFGVVLICFMFNLITFDVDLCAVCTFRMRISIYSLLRVTEWPPLGK